MRTPPFGSWHRKVLVRYPPELGKRGTRVNLFYFLLVQTRNVLCVWVCLCVDVCANMLWGVYTYRISLVRGCVDGRARSSPLNERDRWKWSSSNKSCQKSGVVFFFSFLKFPTDFLRHGFKTADTPLYFVRATFRVTEIWNETVIDVVIT